jgi:energy-coupling factor transporter ATP-binding protein EcfA2
LDLQPINSVTRLRKPIQQLYFHNMAKPINLNKPLNKGQHLSLPALLGERGHHFSKFPGKGKNFAVYLFKGSSHNSNSPKKPYKTYRELIIEELKYLHFLGLPTRNYQRQQLMIIPELERVYIDLEFRDDDFKAITLDSIVDRPNPVVILGEPGAGKTTLVKYLALIQCKKIGIEGKKCVKGKLPFIVYLRELNRQEKGKVDFVDFLRKNAEDNYKLDYAERNIFENILKKGGAVVMFDGLDEVEPENNRAKIAKEIEAFSRKYHQCPIWVTSRLLGYTEKVKLDKDRFRHYYLEPLSEEKAKKFIKKWYEIQFYMNKPLQSELIRSLQYAIEKNPGIKELARNPLLLTMMTLLHQFEGRLPDDRAVLYEKCIELLLKTWQEQKYHSLGIKNPLEARKLRYDDQLKILAAVAFYIKEKNHDIENEKLENVLFNSRYDKSRMSREKAQKDSRLLLDYLYDRAGLFVKSSKGENISSFIYLQFLDYLCAYQIAKNLSKSQAEIINDLLKFIKNPSWQESILISLYLFEKSTGASFIDAFTKAAFERLKEDKDPNGWFLMGRAVRDNIDFANDDIGQIIRGLLNIWLKGIEKNTAFSILKEIANFSPKGRYILDEVIEERIKADSKKRGADLANLHKQLSKMDPNFKIPLNCSG